MAFNFVVNFLRTLHDNGGMTWTITDDSISILYYFNDKNTDLEKIFDLLKSLAVLYSLSQLGWKLPFRMKFSSSETRNRDYFKKIEFYVNK